MKSSIAYATLFVWIGLLCQNCNDPAIIGFDLLKDDEINLRFVDTFTVEAQTLRDTGVLVFDSRARFLSKMPVGNFSDPIFGTTDARIYLQFFRSSFLGRPDFTGATLDSAMLYLVCDTTIASYGKANDLHDYNVFNLTQNISYGVRYRSGQFSISHDMNAIGQITGVNPDIKKTILVIEPSDTIVYPPHIAFRLTESYGKKVMAFDSLFYNSDSIFLSNVRGFMFNQSNINSRMITYDVNSTFSKLNINYTQGGSPKQYSFPISGPRVPYWEHNHSMLIKDALNSKTKGKEFLYLQSLGGLKVKLEFPNLKFPTAAIINKAELEFTVIELPQNDLSTYTPPTQLALYRRDTINGLDVMISDQGGLNDFALLGGRLTTKEVNGQMVKTYTINISNHLQRMLSKKESSEVFLSIAPPGTFSETVLFPITSNLSRVILGGPNHPVYPMKLKISFTTY